MRSSIILVSIALAGLFLSYAHGVSQPDLPPGVSGENWIPISQSTGFVVTPEKNGTQPMPQRPGTINGYFMAKRNGVWQRLNAMSEARLFNLAPER